jgi:hypothetical protein
MNRLTNTATEWKLVVALFIIVLITFSFAQRDSKRLDRLYTLMVEKGATVADAKKEVPAAIPVK